VVEMRGQPGAERLGEISGDNFDAADMRWTVVGRECRPLLSRAVGAAPMKSSRRR
jgi:hypothetical protein